MAATSTAAVVPLHRSTPPALFRPTRVNLFLPPQLARALGAGAVVLGQAFLLAYSREKQRVRRAEEEEGGNGNGNGNNNDDGSSGGGAEGAAAMREMSPLEAVRVLGLDRVNPSLASRLSSYEGNAAAAAAPPRLPVLEEASDRQAATENFERMFAMAQAHGNDFIDGKLSAAYRICVDPYWDDDEDDDGDGDGDDGEDDGEGQQQQQQQQRR